MKPPSPVTRFRMLFWMLCLCSAAVPPAHARKPASEVRAGDRIRVSAPSVAGQIEATPSETREPGTETPVSPLTGVLTRVGPDAIAIRPDSSQAILTVPVAAIERLDVWRRGTRKTAGAFIGLAAGSIIGAAVGSSMESDSPAACTGEGFLCDDFELVSVSSTAQGVIIGALVGTSVGALVGMCFESGRWEPADVHRLQVGFRLADRGEVRLGCSARF